MHSWAIIWILIYAISAISKVIRGGGRPSRASYWSIYHVFADIIAHYGGNAAETGRRRFMYVAADKNLQAEIDFHSQARLTIRVPGSAPFAASFRRLPRLIYAFAEAFLHQELRMPGERYWITASSFESVIALKNRPQFSELFQRISNFGFSVRMDGRGFVFTKLLRPEERDEMTLLEMFRTTRDFARLCTEKVIDIPVQPLQSEQHCAYCKEIISEPEPAVYCSACGTPHHRDCFNLNGKCTVFGCMSVQTTPAQRQEALIS